MSNELFNPMMSTNEVFRNTDRSRYYRIEYSNSKYWESKL